MREEMEKIVEHKGSLWRANCTAIQAITTLASPNTCETMSVINFKQVGYHYGGPIEMMDNSIDLSKLGPTEIVIKVAAAAINPIDLILYNSHKLFTFISRGMYGVGRDFSGTVEATGKDVTKFVKGDKVCGLYETLYSRFGCFSEYMIIDTKTNENIGTIPQNLTMPEAAAFPLVFGTAYTTLTKFKKPSECENVLVIGGSTSVGAFVVQLLKKVHKVSNVISVNSSDSAERVKRYGADIIVDYKKGSVKSQTLALVSDIGKFDLIVDCVGNSDFVDCMEEVLKPKSENSGYVTINGATVGDYTSMVTQYLTWTNIKMLFFPRSWAFAWGSIERGTWFEYAKGLFEEGVLEIPIDSVHKFDNYKDVISTLINHRAQGKVVMTMESSRQ